MYCPSCGSSRTRTLETRDSSSNSIRRRKVCRNCGHNFSTVERIEVYVEGQWLCPEEKIPALELVGPPPVKDAPPAEKPARTQQPPRYWPIELEKVAPDMEGLPAHMQEQAVAWWNTARRAKHGTRATWTQLAWQLSARRIASLWAKGHTALVEQLLAEANESGWQALKPDYLKPMQGAPATPAPAGLVPRSAAMQQAVETWDNSAA